MHELLKEKPAKKSADSLSKKIEFVEKLVQLILVI